ncbi:MAG: hypothetical protein V7785_07645 [Bermanella sp.]
MKNTTLFLGLFLLPIISSAIEPMDGYYSNDLLGAVDEAKETPHHYDYSNTYRYKRTTAQSINLNQIDLQELEKTHLSMTAKNNDKNDILEDPTSPDTFKISEVFQTIGENEQGLGPLSNTLPKNTGRSVSLMGELSSFGIRNESTLHSTTRP